MTSETNYPFRVAGIQPVVFGGLMQDVSLLDLIFPPLYLVHGDSCPLVVFPFPPPPTSPFSCDLAFPWVLFSNSRKHRSFPFLLLLCVAFGRGALFETVSLIFFFLASFEKIFFYAPLSNSSWTTKIWAPLWRASPFSLSPLSWLFFVFGLLVSPGSVVNKPPHI